MANCSKCGFGGDINHKDDCPDRFASGPDGKQEHPEDRFNRLYGIALGTAPVWAVAAALGLAWLGDKLGWFPI